MTYTRSRITDAWQGDPLTPSECRERNSALRKRIWDGTGWPIIDLDDVRDDWTRQAIINECVRQNGPRAASRKGRA